MPRVPKSAAEAKELGWEFHSICPYHKMPNNIHGKFTGWGYQVAADFPFDNQGNLVPVGTYGLWLLPRLPRPK